jgi:bifunctional non-homologous end joining protein LigD
VSIATWRDREEQVRPMLASTHEVPLTDPEFVYEPKYDGVRALARVAPGRPVPVVQLFSRAGNDKTSQFPAIVKALQRFALKLRAPLLLDGELVALDARGEPVGFQHLQGRIHRKAIGPADDTPTAFIAFDLLREGPHDLRGLALTARRAALERVFGDPGSALLRVSPQVGRDGRDLYRQAMTSGWEGLIAKRAASRYVSGKRTSDWAKLKLQHAQEFVIGGWTEPRGSRSHFGALLLGVYEQAPGPASGRTRRPRAGTAPARLVYVGHVGGGFNQAELTRVMKALAALTIARSPFDVPPPVTNETPHWVKPRLVAQVRFTEWTDEGRLRHPTYLGLRDDVDPAAVRREPAGTLVAQAEARLGPAAEPPRSGRSKGSTPFSAGAATRAGTRQASSAGSRKAPRTGSQKAASTGSQKAAPTGSRKAARTAASSGSRKAASTASATAPALSPPLQLVVDQLSDIEQARKAKAVLALPDGGSLEVGNLHKVFWPAEGLTKGDLLRYYVRVSPFILPVVADRPLVMKRYPDGVRREAFYQHRAPDKPPPGVRIEVLPDDDVPSRPVGGSLTTLLYLAQLAAVSQDPWFSRVGSLHLVDHIAFDLDPMPGTSFETVLDVARWLRDQLATVGATGVAKTSGADGLHVYVPMPRRTAYEAGRLWAQIVATLVAARHPQVATVERSVKKRGAKVYVDYLQNIEGKTLACAYSARASEFAGASTPVTWDEIDEGFDRRDFTMRTLPSRVARVGDLWARLWTLKAPDLGRIEKYLR